MRRRWPHLRRRSRVAAVCALSLVAAALPAQNASARDAPSRLFVPLQLQLGLPQGEFAENVEEAGGFGGGFMFRIAGELAVRAELGAMIYGSERRSVPLGGGPIGRVNVEVVTTNSIFGGGLGLQLGLPGSRPRPYVGGTIGFSNFSTSSEVRGTDVSNEPFATTTNYRDATFAKNLMGGLYLPVGKGKGVIDIGVRHTWNGAAVRYLTEGDIVDNPTGPPTITPRRTRADLLTVVLGYSFRF